MLDRLTELLPIVEEEDDPSLVKVAIIGRPNVGKSSLLNRLLGQERSVVSNVPGTTRDTIDTQLNVNQTPMLLIDTAGIRRRGKVERGLEKYSVLRSLRAIERCDVALLLIDANEGVTAQDTHIAGMILEKLKGVAIIVNKWDLIEKDNTTFNAFTQHIREAFNFIPYAPLLFISAVDGQRVGQVLPMALEIARERQRRIPTSEMNALLRNITYDHPPTAIHKGAHLRLYYATQPQAEPPVFLFFANNAKLIHWGYACYIENRIREKYGFTGTPIKIVFRSRDEKVARDEQNARRSRRSITPSAALRPAQDDFVEEYDIGDESEWEELEPEE